MNLKLMQFLKKKIEFLFDSLHGIPIICLHSSAIDSKNLQNGADDRRQSYQR